MTDAGVMEFADTFGNLLGVQEHIPGSGLAKSIA